MFKILATEKAITNKISTKILISCRGPVLGYGANSAANLAYQVGAKIAGCRRSSNLRGQKKWHDAVNWIGNKVGNAALIIRRIAKPI